MPCISFQKGEQELQVPLTTDRSEATPDGCPTVAVSLNGETYYAYASADGNGSAVAAFWHEGSAVYLVSGHEDEDDGSWKLYTADDVAEWASYMSANKDYSVSATLCNDISLSGVSWTAIGTDDNPYTGTFNGKGNTISGLSISASASETARVGFFNTIGESGSVTDLSLEASIAYSSSGGALSSFCVGALAGRNDGVVSGCGASVSVSVSGSDASNAASSGVAGLLGANYGAIENCSCSGTVDVSCTITSSIHIAQAGGIVAYNNGTVSGCENSCTVTMSPSISSGVLGAGFYIAGIAAYNHNDKGVVTGCVNNGAAVNGMSGSYTTYIGGIIGYNSGSYDSCTNNGTPSNEIGK